MPFRSILLFAAMAAAAPALALADEGRRELCLDRPGLGTPACTVDKGDIVIELGIGDWTRDDDGSTRTDAVVAGDALLRIGLTPSLEAQIGWTAAGFVRERDRMAGTVTTRTHVGDVMLALRQNLHNPDGSGFSIAAMPYVMLPVGHQPTGAGDWSAGLIVPASVEMGAVSLGVTPQISAATDGDGKGRHLAYGTTAGIGFGVSDTVSMAVEFSAARDRDPAGHSTELLGGVSAGWQSDADSQWDVGTNIGLNRNSPAVEFYFGFAHRF